MIVAALFCLSFAEGSDRQSISLIDRDGYNVQLIVSERPSLANGGWLTVKVENISGEQDFIDAIDLRVEYKMLEPHEPGSSLSSSLRVPVLAIPHGERSITKLPRGSGKSFSVATEMSGRLGYHEKDVIEVEATAHCAVRLSHGDGDPFRTLSMKTPREGIPFRFFWNGLDEAGTNALVKEMRLLVKHAQPEKNGVFPNQQYTATLLQTPSVATRLTEDELLKLAESNDYLVSFESMRVLFERNPGYKPYLKAYAERIAGWRQVYEMHRTGFWHPDLFDALIDRAESPHDDGNTNSFRVSSMAFRVLEEHRESWGGETDRVARFDKAKWTFRRKHFFNYYGKATTVLGVLFLVIVWYRRRRRHRTVADTAPG